MGIDERGTDIHKVKEDQEAQQWDQYRMSQGKYRAIIRYATANAEEITQKALKNTALSQYVSIYVEFVYCTMLVFVYTQKLPQMNHIIKNKVV
jgi:uncharacterized transporter YbjL